MPSDESKSPLIMEFEEFQRKLEAAARLTRSDFAKEAKRIYDIAFFQYASKARNAEAEKSQVLLVPDADDPERSKAIKGSDQRQRMDGALWYYLEALLEQVRPHIRERFKPVAEIARRSSSPSLLPSNLLFQEALRGAPHYITTGPIESQGPLRALCDFWGRPDWTASFSERFRLLFAEEWERLVCEAELEAPALPPTQASESAGAVDEDESAAERRRRTQQIGDRAVSRQPPAAPQDVRQPSPASIIERIRSSTKKPLYVVIEMFKIDNPGESDTQAILQGIDAMIREIRSEAERNQVRKAVYDSVPSGWKEGIGEQQTLVAYWDKSDPKERGPIKTYVSGVKVIQ
jgi:hypothetical protein